MATHFGRLLLPVSAWFDWPLSLSGTILPQSAFVPVLEKFNPGDIDELHAVYLGQGRLLPVRIRVFLEFLAERIKIGGAQLTTDA